MEALHRALPLQGPARPGRAQVRAVERKLAKIERLEARSRRPAAARSSSSSPSRRASGGRVIFELQGGQRCQGRRGEPTRSTLLQDAGAVARNAASTCRCWVGANGQRQKTTPDRTRSTGRRPLAAGKLSTGPQTCGVRLPLPQHADGARRGAGPARAERCSTPRRGARRGSRRTAARGAAGPLPVLRRGRPKKPLSGLSGRRAPATVARGARRRGAPNAAERADPRRAHQPPRPPSRAARPSRNALRGPSPERCCSLSHGPRAAARRRRQRRTVAVEDGRLATATSAAGPSNVACRRRGTGVRAISRVRADQNDRKASPHAGSPGARAWRGPSEGRVRPLPQHIGGEAEQRQRRPPSREESASPSRRGPVERNRVSSDQQKGRGMAVSSEARGGDARSSSKQLADPAAVGRRANESAKSEARHTAREGRAVEDAYGAPRDAERLAPAATLGQPMDRTKDGTQRRADRG